MKGTSNQQSHMFVFLVIDLWFSSRLPAIVGLLWVILNTNELSDWM